MAPRLHNLTSLQRGEIKTARDHLNLMVGLAKLTDTQVKQLHTMAQHFHAIAPVLPVNTGLPTITIEP